MPKQHIHHNQGMSGELDVSGQDSIDIRLDREPEDVSVEFEDNDISTIPCNPQQYDTLSWEVHRPRVNGFHETRLKITWDVLGTKKIVWIIKY